MHKTPKSVLNLFFEQHPCLQEYNIAVLMLDMMLDDIEIGRKFLLSLRCDCVSSFVVSAEVYWK